MKHRDPPPFCIPCLQRLQAACSHPRIETWGGMHFSGGEVWDDLHEVCPDCGAEFWGGQADSQKSNSFLSGEEPPF